MKHAYHPSPCGCGPARPNPPVRPPQEDSCNRPPVPCRGGYLMQRIFASGRLHRRQGCYALCLDQLPCSAQPPFTVLEVCSCGMPQWEELPCRNRQTLLLQVQIPLQVRLRDGCGQTYMVSSSIVEELPLRYECPSNDCWRGQPYVQASVRLACRPRPCEANCPCDTPLEVLIEGYILAPCIMGCPDRPACPPSLPWYPQPMFDPYQG